MIPTIQPRPLGQRYLMLDLLGTGGMAEVFRSKQLGQKGFEKLIVIKRLLPQVAGDDEMVDHFTAEARLAALLQHENIAAVYDFGEIDGSYFMAMEYLFGKDLHSIIQTAKQRDMPLPPELSLAIIARVCDAMSYAHSLRDLQGKSLSIIHRDLTPHNIFITYDGKVKIIDFGIAKTELHDNRTRLGIVKGKISYMSPEQMAGDEIDHRSDIFTIGISLYEMISGRRMYTGDTAALIRKAITVDYEYLERVRDGLPAELYELLHRALTVSPAERFQSCDEMQAAVDTCLAAMSKNPLTRDLQSYMRSLFASEYRLEKEQGLRALQAAASFESEELFEKTQIFDSVEFSSSKSRQIARPAARRDSEQPEDKTAGIYRSRRKKKAVFWIAGACLGLAGIALLVLLFMQMPADRDKGLEVTSGKQSSASVLPADEETATSDAPDGRQPASDQQRRHIEELLKQAEKALALDKLTTPEQSSALHYYREVEKIAPNNDQVSDGFRSIADRYAHLAEVSMQRGGLAESLQLIEKGLTVLPNYNRLVSLQNRMQHEKAQLLKNLALQAENALLDDRLTTPADDCALKYYKEMLKIDRNNETALEGLSRIGDRYATLADRALKNFEIDLARHYVAEGRAVDPDNWRLEKLAQDMRKSKPELLLQGLEKNLKSLF